MSGKPGWLHIAALSLGLALLSIAWSFASYPFSGPDEGAHFVRAIGLSEGQLLGPRMHYSGPGLPPLQLAFVNHDSRGVHVPARLSPPQYFCANGQSDANQCVEVTPTGDYFPLPYVLPAVGLKFASNNVGGLWLSRLGSVLPCIAFFIAALCALWSENDWAVLGLFGALTPMVLFVCSILNPSGLETAATVAFAAALLRLGREGSGPVPRWIWLLAAISGVATVLSFQAGPGFLIVGGVLAGVATRRGRWAELWRDSKREIKGVAALLVTSLVLWVIYAKISGADHSGISIFPVGESIVDGLGQLGPVLRDAIGHFGGLNIPLPQAVRVLWWASELALVLGACRAGSRRDRVALTIIVTVCLLFPVLSYAWIYKQSGFGMQGRQVLGILALIPLISGELLCRRRAGRSGEPRIMRLPVAAAVLLFAIGQAYAWWFNASTSAEHPVSLDFFHNPSFVPPLGWACWIAVAVVGDLALVWTGVDLALRRRSV